MNILKYHSLSLYQCLYSDVNECMLEDALTLCGPNFECQNEIGSFKCICEIGYKYIPQEDICINVNECDLPFLICDFNAKCVDTPGDFYCECEEGFFGDGWTCEPGNYDNYCKV